MTRLDKVLTVSNNADMYGKAFESQYDGSLVGAGINVFAVWNYIIAKTRRGVIEINPKLLSFILGGEESEIVSALEFLCSDDPKSRSKAENGKRLVKDGEYQYRVVNWQLYDGIKTEDARRDYNREKQAEHRERKKAATKSLRSVRLDAEARERRYVEAYESGNQPAADAIAAEGLP